mmetsp:Transcript_31676/g.73237  ORF Transcript_31676/g.73237 Transcript_31676/m.73237 type:complete len:206 (-) Transcript_31676:705-1322(-)
MSAMLSGAAHMPLPIWPRPGASCMLRPTETLLFSYAVSQVLPLIWALGTTAPASIDVWISSPVRSRKPVLMKQTRSLACSMHAPRLAEVRLSSSIMPILRVCRGSPSSSSTRSKSATFMATSSGPCILGLTIKMLPWRELRRSTSVPLRSCRPAKEVMSASSTCSGIAAPDGRVTASVYRCIPTLRTSMSERRGISISCSPLGEV